LSSWMTAATTYFVGKLEFFDSNGFEVLVSGVIVFWEACGGFRETFWGAITVTFWDADDDALTGSSEEDSIVIEHILLGFEIAFWNPPIFTIELVVFPLSFITTHICIPEYAGIV